MAKRKANKKKPQPAPVSAGGASPEELSARVKRLRESFGKARIDALLVLSPSNVRYLSGFTGDDSALLVTERSAALITDSRYVEEAELSAPKSKVIDRKRKGLGETAMRIAARGKVQRVGVESTHVSLAAWKRLQKTRGDVKLKAVSGLVERLRMIKTPDEVARIEEALRVQEQAFLRTVEALEPGMTERAVAAKLRYEMTREGEAQDQAFSTIVAFGAHASLPHYRPGAAALQRSDLVLIDWGAVADYYHADLTRTFFVGRIPAALGEIWRIVREAQEAAIASVRPGVRLASIDSEARKVIRKAGYARYFGHGTGHGIGLEIHEGPTVGQRGEAVAEPGMVFTIEPGIYLPKQGGVRLEDDVVVTEDGCRVLSTLPHDMKRA
jgi:Xaa-Pro aminopeptidase